MGWIDDGAGTIADHWQRFLALKGRAAITGPHGSGKTTLLTHLVDHARGLGYETRLVRRPIDEALSFLAQRKADHEEHPALLAIDSAEQVPRLVWYLLKQRTKRLSVHLLVTAHRDLGLPVLHERTPTEDLVRIILGNLLDSGDARSEDLSSLPLGEWLARPETARDVLRIMYDRWERQGGVSPPAGRRQQQETSTWP